LREYQRNGAVRFQNKGFCRVFVGFLSVFIGFRDFFSQFKFILNLLTLHELIFLIETEGKLRFEGDFDE